MNVCVYSPGEAPTQEAPTRQEHPMTNRRTSDYSLRVTLPAGDPQTHLDQLRDAALPHVGIVTDTHVSSTALNAAACIGFRAAGDAAALALAADIILECHLAPARWELQTGYGIHRRTVTPEAVTG